MKRIFLIAVFAVAVALLGFSGTSTATTMSYSDTVKCLGNCQISTTGTYPSENNWFQLSFANGTTASNHGSYSGGTFDYNTYYPTNSNGQVSVFTITIKGKNGEEGGANSANPIDVWIDFDSTHGTNSGSAWGLLGTFVPSDKNFTQVYDITTNTDLMTAFHDNDVNSFWVGYACHFTLASTAVNVQILTPSGNQVPEPTSLLLLGTGLGVIGLVARRRKRA